MAVIETSERSYRPSARRRALLALALVGVAVGAMADEAEGPLVEVVHLAGPVHMIRTNTPIGNPSTCVSAGEDGAFVVDPNLEGAGAELEAAIAGLGGPVRLVATTHYHGDHAEALERFVPGAVALAPHAQRVRLAEGPVVLGERPVRHESLPSITFGGSLVVHMNGEAIEVFTPENRAGHTDGDALVHFRDSGVLCIGDYLFLDKYPIVDLAAGGDLEGYLANVDALVERFPEDTLVVPGHGTFPPEPPRAVGFAEVVAHQRVLRATIDWVRDGLETGRGADELVAEGLPAEFTYLGERPRFVREESWIRLVYGYYAERAGDDSG